MTGIDRIYRIPDFIHILGFSILGIFYSGAQFGPGQAVLLLINFFALMFIFSINNYFDRESDPHAKNFFAGRRLGRMHVFLIVAMPAIASLLLCFFMLSNSLSLLLIVLLTGALYSAPPACLKRITFVGTISNAVMFVPFFAMAAGTTIRTASISALFSIYLIIAQLIHEKQDIKEDHRFSSTARFLGRWFRAALAFLIILFLGISAALFYHSIIGMSFLALNILLSLATLFAIGIYPPARQLRTDVKILSLIYGIALCAIFYLK